jgi:hypothetical protein
MTNNDDRIPLTNSKTEVHNHSANKYSKRIRTKNKQFKDYISELEYASAANISVKKALTSDRAKESRDAILDEIKTMIDYNVGYFQKFEDIPHDSKSQILRTFMFLKNKETPDGRFERVKARLVVNGAQQNKALYDLISSATVNTASVLLLMNIASFYRCRMTSYDIKGAFLNAQFQSGKDENIYIRIDADVSKIWCEQDDSAIHYLQADGTLILLLDKFIYGLKQAPLKFQEHLTKCLSRAGYNQLLNDPCVYIKRSKTKFSMLSVHVDDILQISNCDDMINDLYNELTKEYKTIVFHPEVKSYLGITVQRGVDSRDIYLSQQGLLEKILKENQTTSEIETNTPNSLDLFTYESRGMQDTNKYTRKKYLSLIMSLMFLARMTRPDILLTVSYLATKANTATNKDMDRALRVVRYLNNTKSFGLHLNCNGLQIQAHCDASYGAHLDGHSHTGFTIAFGTNLSFLLAKSAKQKISGTSSTDAELIAAADCVKQMVWIQNLLQELTIPSNDPTILYQDNKSTIVIITQPTKFKHVKHLITRIHYIRQLYRDGAFKVKYVPTELMYADALTKPLTNLPHYRHIKQFGVVRLPLIFK